ncbi:unnamed protein product, partial [Ectocarpus sp. 12 AP-2014]
LSVGLLLARRPHPHSDDGQDTYSIRQSKNVPIAVSTRSLLPRTRAATERNGTRQ